MNPSAKILAKQYKELVKNPVYGFKVELNNESDLYIWNVYIEGPSDGPYTGGIFKAQLKFPKNYPFSPPEMKFISEFWHPNVYKDGKVCISILHPPGNDPYSGERPEERWLPTQTPETILLSVISMISDPNISSPANVDASVEFRKKKENYKKRIQKLIIKAQNDLPKGFKMPNKKDIMENQRQISRKAVGITDQDLDDDQEMEFQIDIDEYEQDDDDEDDEDEDYNDDEDDDDDDDDLNGLTPEEIAQINKEVEDEMRLEKEKNKTNEN